MKARTTTVGALLFGLSVAAAAGCGKGKLEAENQQLKSEIDDLRAEATQAPRGDDSHAAAPEPAGREGARPGGLGLAQQVEQQLHDMLASNQLRVRAVRYRVTVELPETALFDADGVEIKATGKETLAKVAHVLGRIPDHHFLVADHTGTMPTGGHGFASTLDLSAARAVAVAKFVGHNGMDASRLGAAGYFAARPGAANGPARADMRAGRIDIVILPSPGELSGRRGRRAPAR